MEGGRERERVSVVINSELKSWDIPDPKPWIVRHLAYPDWSWV